MMMTTMIGHRHSLLLECSTLQILYHLCSICRLVRVFVHAHTHAEPDVMWSNVLVSVKSVWKYFACDRACEHGCACVREWVHVPKILTFTTRSVHKTIHLNDRSNAFDLRALSSSNCQKWLRWEKEKIAPFYGFRCCKAHASHMQRVCRHNTHTHIQLLAVALQ